MLYYNRNDVSEGTDLAKNNKSKECMIFHYWFFNHGFRFQDYVCNVCHSLTMLCLDTSDITIITVNNVDYRCIIHNISKSEGINLLKMLYLKIVSIYKKHCLNFHSNQDSSFTLFCLLYIKWLILWTSVSL